MKKSLLILCLVTLCVPSFVLATQVDSIEFYTAAGNTTTLNNKTSYYNWDYFRTGFRTYKDNFMFRAEIDQQSMSVKYTYLEYSKQLNDWKIKAQFGKYLIPMMYNFPGSQTRPMPRYARSIEGLSVYGTGISLYAQYTIFKIRFANFGFEKYASSVDIGPINIWWNKNEGQGLAFEKSLSPWLNLRAGWSNYEDNPKFKNAAFIQNYFHLDRIRIYMHQDFGNFHGQFIGGVSYMLFPNDKESTISIFHDSIKKWQIRMTFGVNKIL